MPLRLPNGSLVAIEATTGPIATVTGISNAATAVATTSATHNFAAGDFVRISSGWSRLDGKLVRVAATPAPTGTTFGLEGIDTTNTSVYPAGGGAGSATEALTFTQIPLILGVTSDGGEQQFATAQPLEADREVRAPTVKSASGLTLTVGDDPTGAAYAVLSAASDLRAQRGIRITLPDGALILYYGYVSINKTPTFTVNEFMTYTVTLSLNNDPVRYAAPSA